MNLGLSGSAADKLAMFLLDQIDDGNKDKVTGPWVKRKPG